MGFQSAPLLPFPSPPPPPPPLQSAEQLHRMLARITPTSSPWSRFRA
jgi:hypothetical protein